MNVALLLPSIILFWAIYKQSSWVKNCLKAKIYFQDKNENLNFIFGIRVNYHTFKLMASIALISVYLFVSYNIDLKNLIIESTKSKVITTVFLLLICFSYYSFLKTDGKLSLLIAKTQNFTTNAKISSEEKSNILYFLHLSKFKFILFSICFFCLTLSIYYWM